MAKVAGTAINPKRFRFVKEFDSALLRCVGANSAQQAGHGKTEENYGGVLAIFLVTPEYLSRTMNVPPPQLKAVRKNVKKLLKKCLIKSNIAVSGIAEKYGELEQLLDSIIK